MLGALPWPNLRSHPARFVLSRRRHNTFCGLAKFKPKVLISRREFVLSRLGALASTRRLAFNGNFMNFNYHYDGSDSYLLHTHL